MSSYVSSFPIHDSAIGGYVGNVGRTARAFLAALLAVKPAATVKPVSSARTKAHFFAALQFEAARYDDVMPNLSAELRFIAGRS